MTGSDKKLSKLQKKILALAYKNHSPGARVDASNRDILVNVYGFPYYGREPIRHSHLLFSREAIGLKQYNSASVAVAKTFNRLCDRGLAIRICAQGIKLTEAGIETAKELNG